MSKADTRSAADEPAADEPGTDQPAADEPATDSAVEATSANHSTIDGISQAAGDAAQRAGVAAQRATEVLTDVAGDVAATVSAHAPAVIDASRSTAGIAAREVQAASSENLLLGTAFSSGLALGLMLARVPRVLVLGALVPAFVLGGNLVGRRTGRGPRVTGAPKATTSSSKRGTSSGA